MGTGHRIGDHVLMRSPSLTGSLAALVIGCTALVGCGTVQANDSARTRPTGSPMSDSPDSGGADLRFLDLMNRFTQECTPDASSSSGAGAPDPKTLPEAPTGAPAYGPGQTPPGTPNADGDIPVPVADPASPAPELNTPGPVNEIPLTGIERCSGAKHAERIVQAFGNKGPTGYQALARTLRSAGYPAERIHRMSDHDGAPRARMDLRVADGHLALEVTGTSRSVIVESFGAPTGERLSVLDVRRKPNLDAPS